MLIETKIDALKNDIIKQKLSLEELFQKHVIDCETYYFKHVLFDIEKEYEIRTLISKALNVHIHEIKFVGSAKLGFSLNPKNLFNHFDNKFNQTKKFKDKSDLDIAVISTELFEFIGKSMFQFTDSYKNKWVKNEYYDEDNKFNVPICYKFFEYYTKGWFRLDFKPIGYDFCNEGSFEELKQKLYTITNRKLGLAIYKDWYFFKNYHIYNLDELMLKVKRDVL